MSESALTGFPSKSEHQMANSSFENEHDRDEADIEEKRRRIHREIEQYRRSKFAKYIKMLGVYVPLCSSCSANETQKRLKKLTVLNWTIQMLSEQFTVDRQMTGKALFMQNTEYEQLMLQAADSFMFAVDAQTGQVLYVTQTVTDLLGVPIAQWLSRDCSIFRQIHHNDHQIFQNALADGNACEVQCRFLSATPNGSVRCVVNGQSKITDRSRFLAIVQVIRNEVSELNSSLSDPEYFTTRHDTNAPLFSLSMADDKVTQVLGWQTGDLSPPASFFGLVYPDSYQSHIVFHLEAMALRSVTEEVVIRGAVATSKSGNRRYFDLRVCPIVNPFTSSLKFIVCKHYPSFGPAATDATSSAHQSYYPRNSFLSEQSETVNSPCSQLDNSSNQCQ